MKTTSQEDRNNINASMDAFFEKNRQQFLEAHAVMQKSMQPFRELHTKILQEMNTNTYQTMFKSMEMVRKSITPVILAHQQSLKSLFEAHQIWQTQIDNVLKSMVLLPEENFLRVINAIPKIDQKFFSIFQNDSFKSAFENLKNLQLDKLSEVDENDFEEFIQQLQIKDNADAIEKQVTQNPILLALLLALLIAFFEQTGSNMSDIFVKPQLEKLQDIFENNMDETRVLTNTVNLREAPKGTAKSLLKLEANQTIKVLSKSGNWFKVRYFYDTDEYIEGWVCKRYAKKIDAVELNK